MYHILSKNRFPFLLFFAAFLLGILIAHTRHRHHSPDQEFLAFTAQVFQEELQGNTLSLHYTVSDPSSYGIHNYPITLGNVSSQSWEPALSNLQEQLHRFPRESLSLQNQLTYDIMEFTLESQRALSAHPLLQEPLSPTLGIQAQLPILLAEYTFRNKQDYLDYFALLEKVPSYFQQILAFEQEKAKAGLFMKDTTAQRIIEQCSSFLSSKENYLVTVFQEALDSSTFLSEKERNDFQKTQHQKIRDFVIPAYQMLSQGLSDLMGRGKNPWGLFYYPQGADYYLSYLHASVGTDLPMDAIVERLHNQLNEDYLQIRRLLTVDKELPDKFHSLASQMDGCTSPQEMLEDLRKQIRYDFPSLENVTYTVNYVCDALSPYLSPAFYLTPPIDTGQPNIIYLNPLEQTDPLSLYTTLAHEGFPGHMYQTLYFASTDPDPIRVLFANSGYIEGWATYIESYAYEYAPTDHNTGRYAALNRSFYLSLYSLLDIYIHYYGWTAEEVSSYLTALGITDPEIWEEIYQILLEDPGNYLKYSLGAIMISDLKQSLQEDLGSSYSTMDFHKALLQIGPAPFPIIEQYIKSFLQK